MCGDIEEDAEADEAIRQRVRALAKEWKAPKVTPGTVELGSPEAKAAYMQARCTSLIAALLGDVEGTVEGQAADIVSSQSILLGRLAGLLAAQLDPHNDPLRYVLEAVLYGYKEQEEGDGGHHDHDHHDHDHHH